MKYDLMFECVWLSWRANSTKSGVTIMLNIVIKLRQDKFGSSVPALEPTTANK